MADENAGKGLKRCAQERWERMGGKERAARREADLKAAKRSQAAEAMAAMAKSKGER